MWFTYINKYTLHLFIKQFTCNSNLSSSDATNIKLCVSLFKLIKFEKSMINSPLTLYYLIQSSYADKIIIKFQNRTLYGRV